MDKVHKSHTEISDDPDPYDEIESEDHTVASTVEPEIEMFVENLPPEGILVHIRDVEHATHTDKFIIVDWEPTMKSHHDESS